MKFLLLVTYIILSAMPPLWKEGTYNSAAASVGWGHRLRRMRWSKRVWKPWRILKEQACEARVQHCQKSWTLHCPHIDSRLVCLGWGAGPQGRQAQQHSQCLLNWVFLRFSV